MKPRLNAALTRLEILALLAVVAIFAILLWPSISSSWPSVNMIKYLSNSLNIWKAMANYAVQEGRMEFPAHTKFGDPSTLVTDSNSAFEILMEAGLLDDKKVFFNEHSAWCVKQEQNAATAKRVLPGECDWCYVVGLKHEPLNDADTSSGIRHDETQRKWPLLANAFAPGTTYYVDDRFKKGGVWKGQRAVVIYAGGEGDVAETLERDGHFIIPRSDKPQADAFQKDGDWLAGDDVKVLYPK